MNLKCSYSLSRSPLRAFAAAFAVLSAATVCGESRASAGPAVPQAVDLYVTPRGQQYFVNNLQDLLFRNGFQFDQMDVPAWGYTMDEAFTLSKLPTSLKKYQGELNDFRDTLLMLLGLQLNDPRISVNATEIKYAATLSTLSLKLDPELTAKYATPGKGAVFVLELVVPTINASIEKVMATDLDNPKLGSFGLSKITASLAKGSQPIKAQVPILLQTDKEPSNQIQILTPVTNVGSLNLSVDPGTVVLPKGTTGFIINGNLMPARSNGFRQLLLKYRTALLKTLQHYLQTYAETNLATTLDGMIKQGIPNGIQENDTINPPGEDNPPVSDRFTSDLQLARIGTNAQQSVYFGLDGVVTDPRARYATALAPGVPNAKTATAQDSVDASTYDMAVNINQSLINRMIQLSYERGLFKNVKMDDGTTIQITDRPRLTIDGSAGPNTLKLHLAVSQPEGGIINWLFVENPVVVEFDLIARFVRKPNGDVAAAIDSIDEKSIYINPKYIKMDTSMVYSKARSAIEKKNAGFKSKTSYLIDQLPMPQSIFGIPVQIKDFAADPNGYITIFLEYGEH